MKSGFEGWTQAMVDQHNAKVAKLPSPTAPPPKTTKAIARERDLHDAIEELCRLRGYLYRHDRMDKPTTGQVGFPDFAIWMPFGKCLFLECKAKGGKTTTAQLAKLAHAKKLGFIAEVVDNFEDAKSVIERAKTTSVSGV